MPRPPTVARTTESLSANVFGDLLARARASGKRIFPLHVGDTYRDPPDGARIENLSSSRGLYTYAPPAGDPVLLDAIVARERARGSSLTSENLQVMSGATAGLSVVASALLDPGDEVIIPSRCRPRRPPDAGVLLRS